MSRPRTHSSLRTFRGSRRKAPQRLGLLVVASILAMWGAIIGAAVTAN
jgi:hypothetical protein